MLVYMRTKLLGFAAVMALLVRGEAKPTIPQESIPADMPAEVRRYAEQLYSRDAVTRGTAAHALGRLGDRAEAAVPYLIAMLGDDDVKLEWEKPDVDPAHPIAEAKKHILGLYDERKTTPGREAARSLGMVCGSAPDALLAALKSEAAAVRKNAAEACGEIRDKKATRGVMLLLQDADKAVRERAAYALGRLRDTAATEALMAAMKDPERTVRQRVVLALGELKDPRALTVLLDALLDNVEVQAAAEAALMETRDLRAVEPLIVSLRHRKEEVRRTSARLLGNIGDRRAIRPLIFALKDPAGDVRFEAAAALKRLSGQDLGAEPTKWQRWHELDLAAREIEDKLGDPPVHSYIGFLHSANWAARAYAAKALGNLGDRGAVLPLRGALWDRDAGVRVNAAVALGQLKDARAIESLIAATSDPEPDVQEAAEGALKRITGAYFARDTRKWQEWWDENRETAYWREGDVPDEEAAARRALEEGPQKVRLGRGTLVLLGALTLLAVTPLVALAALRRRSRRRR
ncbi:MAG: HEAT repeat domain-containing protein [Planctomycetes bacterium]|nr:HEAT repeat domain-containing protein [Planctomycetota bacterium]